MDLSDVDDEDTRSTHEQLLEFPDGASEVMACATLVNRGSFERDEDDVQINDDEEFQSFIESESEAALLLFHKRTRR